MSFNFLSGALARFSYPLLAAALVAIPHLSDAQSRAPRVVVPEPSFNFGSVPQGQRVVHEYELRNAGDGDLTIQRVSPACGCTATTVTSNTVKPGGSEKIKVEFDTTGFSGEKKKSIQVLTNAADKPELTLTLVGTVVRGVSLQPERLDFGEIGASRVIVEFEGEKQSSVNIPVSASVLADLRVIPSTVSFGIVGGSQVIERRVKFENSSSSKVAVSGIESSHPAVSASLIEVEAGKKGVVVVKLDPARMTGDVKANLELKTNHPVDRVVSLSVYGMQPPR